MAMRALPFSFPVNLNNASGTLAVAHGGTGATTASGARANLGISSAGPGTAIAGETLVAGNVIRFDASGGANAGKAYKASTSVSNSDVVGIVTTGGSSGATVEYVLVGAVDVLFAVAPAATDNGKTVYLTSVAGYASLTRPTSGALYVLGQLQGGDGSTTTPQIWMNPEFVVLL